MSPEERPDFGRSYQTPFADAIRNRVGIATIAVGAISSYDDVNSLILAGRADLCALGRVHLYDPMWTLHAALDQDYDGPGVHWPDPWLPGRRKPQTGRTDGPRAAAARWSATWPPAATPPPSATAAGTPDLTRGLPG